MRLPACSTASISRLVLQNFARIPPQRFGILTALKAARLLSYSLLLNMNQVVVIKTPVLNFSLQRCSSGMTGKLGKSGQEQGTASQGFEIRIRGGVGCRLRLLPDRLIECVITDSPDEHDRWDNSPPEGPPSHFILIPHIVATALASVTRRGLLAAMRCTSPHAPKHTSASSHPSLASPHRHQATGRAVARIIAWVARSRAPASSKTLSGRKITPAMRAPTGFDENDRARSFFDFGPRQWATREEDNSRSPSSPRSFRALPWTYMGLFWWRWGR